MASNFEILTDKLDQFIRQYYLDLLLKGAMLFGAGFLFLFLLLVLLEYIGYFSTSVRLVLFYAFFVFNLFVFVRFIIRPLAGFLKIGKRISDSQAAKLIGQHFKSEVNDRITNTLQLQKYLEENPGHSDLVLASIEQKSQFAIRFPFSEAINRKMNLKLVSFFLFPLFIVLLILFLKPSVVVDPASRIARYQTHFSRPAPFAFVIESELTAFRGEGIDIVARSQGAVFPSQVVLKNAHGKYNMVAKRKGVFSHSFRNLQDSFEFYFESEGFLFGPYLLRVVQKPSFSHFNVVVENPAYTRLGTIQYSNVGDIIVAQGAKIFWEFNTIGNSRVTFLKNNTEVEGYETKPGLFSLSVSAHEPFRYSVYTWNKEVGKGDSLGYFVQVKPDAWPGVQIEVQQDSVQLAHVFFRGVIHDDYGLSNLQFNHRIIRQAPNEAGDEAAFNSHNLAFERNSLNQTFYFHFDLNKLNIQPGQIVEYFFAVTDNDAVNGPKTTRSNLFSLLVPTRDELMAIAKENSALHKSNIDNEISSVRQSMRDIEEIRKQLLNNETIGWQQRSAIENLLDRQREAAQNFDRLHQEMMQNQIQQGQFSEMNEQIRQKQEQLNKLYEEVVTDELRTLIEKLREELSKLDRSQVNEMLNQLGFELRNFENHLDRALELFRQLELEKLLQQSIDLLGQARDQQEQNVNTTRMEHGKAVQSIENQKDINSSVRNVSDYLNEFRQKNLQLRRPHRVDNTSEAERSLSEEVQRALEQLERGRTRQSIEHQQGAGVQMEQLELRLGAMQAAMAEQQLAEDTRALRQILENLLKCSFAQEELLLEMRDVNVNDPRYVTLLQEQKIIQDNFKMVEDSLLALSRRQLQIGSFVNREIAQINLNLEKGLEDLINRRRFQGASRQQFVLTHINNLALLLNESLQNMLHQMASGSGTPLPGAGQSNEGLLLARELQEQLNQMLEQLQQGHRPMPGQTGQNQTISEQLARLAAQQEAIRNMLGRMSNELKQQGIDARALEELQRDMERTELDIVTQNISRITTNRQQSILSRLLEHEKALLERGQEERRVGTTAKNEYLSNPSAVFQYNSKMNRELEMLRSVPPGLRPYYRLLVENYFLNVE